MTINKSDCSVGHKMKKVLLPNQFSRVQMTISKSDCCVGRKFGYKCTEMGISHWTLYAGTACTHNTLFQRVQSQKVTKQTTFFLLLYSVRLASSTLPYLHTVKNTE